MGSDARISGSISHVTQVWGSNCEIYCSIEDHYWHRSTAWLISCVSLNPYLWVYLRRQCSIHCCVYLGLLLSLGIHTYTMRLKNRRRHLCADLLRSCSNVDNLATVLVPRKFITIELIPNRGECCLGRCVVPLDSGVLCYGSVVVRLVYTYLECAEHVAELCTLMHLSSALLR
jgi:hypothetical protein